MKFTDLKTATEYAREQAIEAGIDLATIVRADAEGTRYANNLKVGDRFLGTAPAARAAGFTGRAALVFSHAALDVLDLKHVWTDDNGVITRVTNTEAR